MADVYSMLLGRAPCRCCFDLATRSGMIGRRVNYSVTRASPTRTAMDTSNWTM
jgi:hypothetical protein